MLGYHVFVFFSVPSGTEYLKYLSINFTNNFSVKISFRIFS